MKRAGGIGGGKNDLPEMLMFICQILDSGVDKFKVSRRPSEVRGLGRPPSSLGFVEPLNFI